MKFLHRWIALFICLIAGVGLFISWVGLVQAEGSRNLYPNGATGSRANINWRTNIFGQLLLRRTLLKVYAENGEFILVASSAVGDTSNLGGGTGVGDILIYPDSEVGGTVGNETLGAPAFSCLNQRNTVNPNLGSIDSRAAELAGPDTIVDAATGTPGGAIPNAYAPCFYPVTATGIYYVVFYGPEGDGSDFFIPANNTGEIDLTNPINFDGNQLTSVTAWDVTVRDALDSTADIEGRLFTDYLSMVTGNNNRFVNSTLFVLTRDGYIYQTNLGGIDPNAFVFFANNVGFLDNGVPLYRDIIGTNDNLDGLLPGISLAPPNQLIFFNQPDPSAIAANGIVAPVVPLITSMAFGGSLGGNNTLLGAGGTFTYTSNIIGIYELVISRDGINFDPTEPTNRVLRGVSSALTQNIPWDGSDNAGNQFPVGLNYPVRIIIRAGEYHFPLLDAENSAGGPRYILLNSPSGTCPNFNGGTPSCSIAFYDDRGYTTSNGDNVGTPGVILPGNVPPNPDRSDPLAGFDTSTSNQRAYGNGTINGFGDRKGLDIWTYFPSNIVTTTLNIFAFDLVLNKTDGGITTAPGGTIVYTLTYTNTGPSDATGVVISDTVPANTTFNATASAPTVWSCPDGSPAGTSCTTSIGTVPGNNTPGIVTFAVTVNNPLPPGVTQIDNAATVGDDGTHGPDPTPPNNSSSDTTPLNVPPPPIPPPDLTLTKSARSNVVSPSETIVFDLVYANVSTTTATGVVISDTVPANTTFNAAASAPTVWSCPDGSLVATICTTSIGTVVGNSNGAVNFAVKVNNPLPSGVTQIDNAAIVGDDGTHGPDPTPQNNRDDASVPVKPIPVPPPGGNDGGDDDDDDGDTSPPPAAPAPPSAPSVAAQPTPALPVVFLPETGTREVEQAYRAMMALGLLISLGASVTALWFWCKRENR
jgi:uncharacterized repeat protein (TIGR01451 family)